VAKILLVDNDPLLACLRKSILERRFDEVERVSDAAEAFCLVEQPQFADRLGLVVSGHHMPGIGGPAFVAELLVRLPGLPVLVLGDSNEAAGDYCGEGVRFLSRPTNSEQLLSLASQMVRQGEPQTA
jgi:CheY-like chemotaxis protein